MTDDTEFTRAPRRRTCDHGAYLGACDVPDCPDYAGGHRCTTTPCSVVGCPNSRPAPPDPYEAFELDLRAARQAERDDPNPADFPPEAVSVWEETQRLAARESSSSAMPGALIGRDEQGHAVDGAGDWAWRPPVFKTDDTRPDAWGRVRDLDPIQFRGETRYQPAPPIYSHHARPGTAKDIKRQSTVITESKAQREMLAREAERVPRAELAKVAGMTPSQLRRAITKRNRERQARSAR